MGRGKGIVSLLILASFIVLVGCEGGTAKEKELEK